MEVNEKEGGSSLDFLFTKIYSSVFSALMLVLLISFISKPGLSLADISNGFRWKSNLITLYSSVRFKIGDRVFNTALVGKDGWIFYTGDHSMQDYQKIDTLDKKSLITLVEKINQLDKELEYEGKILLIVIPPNKSTIYPQYMPDEIPVIGKGSRLDLFSNYLKNNTQVHIVDLAPVLLDSSKTQNLYFKIDTHWNDLGAYYGYREIMSLLTSYDPRLIPHPLSDYKYIRQDDLINPDLPRVLGIPPIKEEYRALIPKFPVQKTQTLNLNLANGAYISNLKGQDDRLPTLLIFHDSFYSARSSLSHFMEPHFSKITGILFTQDPKIWSLNWIQQEDPDIVIIEIVERNFDTGLSLLLDGVSK